MGWEGAAAFLRTGACPAGPVLELMLVVVSRRNLLPSVCAAGRVCEAGDPGREAGLPEALRPAP
jgi:hypothetical protein